MGEWHDVGRIDELGAAFHKFMVAGRRVVVGRLEGRFYAFDALCPHAGGDMATVEVQGRVVSCPLHAWRFDCGDGGRELHGYRSLAMHDVKTEGESVLVALRGGEVK